MSESDSLFRTRKKLVLPLFLLSLLVVLATLIIQLFVEGFLGYALNTLAETSLQKMLPEYSRWNTFGLCLCIVLILTTHWVKKGEVSIPTLHNGILMYRGQMLREKRELYTLGLHKRISWIMRLLFDGIFMSDGKWWVIPGLHTIKTVAVDEKTKKISLIVPMVVTKGVKKQEDTIVHKLEVVVEYSAYPHNLTEYFLNKDSYAELDGYFKGAAMSLAANQDVGPYNIFEATISHGLFAAAMFRVLNGNPIPKSGDIEGLEEARQEAEKIAIKSSPCTIDVAGTGLRVTMFKIEDIRPADELTRKALDDLSKEIVQKIKDLVEATTSGESLRKSVVSMYLPSNFTDLTESEKKEALKDAENEAKNLLADPKRLAEFTRLSLINRGKIKDARSIDFSFNTSLSDLAVADLAKALPLMIPLFAGKGASSGGKKGEKR